MRLGCSFYVRWIGRPADSVRSEQASHFDSPSSILGKVARSNSGDLLFRLCALVAFGACIWWLRRFNLAQNRFEEDLAARVDRSELSDDSAIDIMVKQRSLIAARKAKNTWLFFVLTIVAVTPFLAPFPLNVYWRPWGQIVLLICAFTFFMTVLNTAFWFSEWYGRREMEKELKGDGKR
jgi:hypothetical protein